MQICYMVIFSSLSYSLVVFLMYYTAAIIGFALTLLLYRIWFWSRVCRSLQDAEATQHLVPFIMAFYDFIFMVIQRILCSFMCKTVLVIETYWCIQKAHPQCDLSSVKETSLCIQKTLKDVSFVQVSSVFFISLCLDRANRRAQNL